MKLLTTAYSKMNMQDLADLQIGELRYEYPDYGDDEEPPDPVLPDPDRPKFPPLRAYDPDDEH